MTPLQLAHAYATLGAGGVSRPVTLRRVEGPVAGQRVVDERVARELLGMMESVVARRKARARRAALTGYRVAGKTGTAWKAAGGYGTDDTRRYIATFGGVVPASQPELAAIVVIDEPGGKTLLRGRCRGAGVRERHGGRAATDGRAAGRPGAVAERDARAGEAAGHERRSSQA